MRLKWVNQGVSEQDAVHLYFTARGRTLPVAPVKIGCLKRGGGGEEAVKKALTLFLQHLGGQVVILLDFAS